MRKGSCVIYEGKFYRVQQKKGNTVIFYDPTSRTPEATMHATSIINVKEARPENGYIITQYTTPAGAVRVEIRPAKDPTWPWLDIPFNELHAHVLEILKTTSGALFIDQRTTTACEYIPEYIQTDPLPEESNQDMRRFTIYTDSNMAGIDSRGAYTTLAEARMRLEKELDEDETSRGGYIFDELRQKVTAIYNGFNIEKIPEPYRGTPNEYTTRKQQDATRAMLESIMNKCSEPTPATSTEANQDTTTGAQEGPTTAGTTAANETPTTAETAPQDATSDATTAETATEGPETSTAAQDTTGSDTRPPRATEDATTGHAANTGTPANQEPGTAADHPGKAAEAITGRTTTPPQNPGHACENAPGRTERAQAEQVHTAHTKSPPRAKTGAGRNTSRSSQDRRKVTFSAWMYKTGSDPPKI